MTKRLKRRAKNKAQLVVNVGIQPSEYDRLTLLEQEAIIREFNRVNRKKHGKR